MIQGVPSDSLRRVVGDVFTQPDYQWVERRQPLLWLRNLWRSLLDWVNGLADNHPAGFNLLLWISVVLLLLLVLHIGYVLWRIVQPTARTASTPEARAVVSDAAAHRARAAELARAGLFAEALGHRFLAVVLDLERREALRYHASKTPAEYVGELRLGDADRATFAGLVGTLYRHLFGAVPLDAGAYEAFGDTADQLTRSHVVPA